MDKSLLSKDPHFKKGCPSCHKGDPKASDKKVAHATLVRRPSDDLKACANCHGKITKTYGLALHYTAIGLRSGVVGRFSKDEVRLFDEKVFEQSCRSCHASCGECHVKSPVISGVNLGLIQGHRFLKKDEGKTCALCHGGRVYPEFTGEYGGTADVHYRKGMLCTDCHSKREMHGDGKQYLSRKDVKGVPSCLKCHPAGKKDEGEKAAGAHKTHAGVVSCSSCHSAGAYRNCTGCHLGKGATSKPGLFIGKNPRTLSQFTTLRFIPTVRTTFEKAGIKQGNFDALPNYWDTIPHNTSKRTDRTRSCGICHDDWKYFLTKEQLPKDGSTKNADLVR